MSITRDATSLWCVPANAAEWLELWVGTSLLAPNFAQHGCQDAADPITDSVGTDNMTALAAFPTYQQSKAGWSRKAFVYPDASAGFELGSHSAINTSTLQLAYIFLDNVAPAADRTVMYAQGELRLKTTGKLAWAGTIGTPVYGAGFHPVIIRVNQTAGTSKCFTDLETIVATYTGVSNQIPFFGGAITSSAAISVLFAATWTGAAAEVSDADIATMLARLQNGPPASVASVVPPDNSVLALLRFDEPKDQVTPSDQLGWLNDLGLDTGLSLPPVTTAFCGFGRAFSNGFAFDATDRAPGATLTTRDVTVQTILSWDLTAQNSYGQNGTIVARGKGNNAAEYVSYALEFRVVNVALQIGELRLWWQDTGGVVKTQQGGQFILPPAGSFMMLTAVRHWIDSTHIEVRYYAGGTLLAEFASADGDIGGGTTGTFCVGTRYSAGVAGAFLCGVIDELRVLNYELTAEEIGATWDRISRWQPRGVTAMRQLMQPGAPITNDPSSRIQKLLRIVGHALGYGSAQAENFRQNLLPDRAYGPALAEWESIVGEAARATDTVQSRRKRVVSHLRQKAGVSIPGVAATVADMLAIGKTQVQVLAFDQTVRDDFSAGLKTERWFADPAAQWTIATNALRVQAANGADITFDGGTNKLWYTCLAAALGARNTPSGGPASGRYNGQDSHIIAKIVPTTLPTHGEVGVVFYDWVNGNAILFGLRNNAGTYQIVTEAFQTWVSQGVTVQATSSLTTHWLHMWQHELGSPPAGKKNHTAAWSTTSQIAGFTNSANILQPQNFDYMGMYARSFNYSASQVLGAALDVAIDDVVMRNPFGTRPYRWYVYRDPALPGTPDIVGAEAAIQRLQQSQTVAHVITSKSMLADTVGCGADRTPAGAI